MSKISLAPNAAGTAIFTIESPGTSTNRTLTLPDDTGTIVTNSGNQAGSFTTLNTSGEVVFNDAGADVDFRVEGDTDANLLFVDASTDRVGVGTNAPGSIFELKAATPLFGINGTTGNSARGITFQQDGTRYGSLTLNTNSGEMALSSGENGNGFFLTFKTDTGAEKARITSGGYFKASNDGTYVGSTGNYHEFRSTENNHSLIISNPNASLATSAICYAVAVRNTTDNTFYALGYFNDGAGAWKFRVADSGNVTNTNNSYGAISDVKLKQDIVDAGSQWDDIKGLRVRKFRWKSDPDGFMQMGLVAQEAEEVSPGLIDEHHDYEEVEVPVLDDEGNAVLNEDGTPQVTKERNALGTTTKAVKYSVLYMKAVKALQEAMERIETLEAKVAALEANNGV